jgi:hypothetical protein
MLAEAVHSGQAGGGDSHGAQQLSLRFVHLKPICAESAVLAQGSTFIVELLGPDEALTVRT